MEELGYALRLAREFGLRPTIVHGTEGHLIAEALREEGAPVISTPQWRRRCPRTRPAMDRCWPGRRGDVSG